MRQPSARAALGTVLAAALSVLSVANASAQPPGRVNGVVRDDDGQPVKGAVVTAQNESVGASQSASTDDKGRFTIIGLRPGDWTFFAQAPGFAASGGRMNVRAASNLNAPMLFTIRRNGPGAGGALEKVTAKDLQAQLASADALLGQRKWDEAIAAYRALMASAPPLSFLNLQVAAAYMAKNDTAGAQAAYEEMLKLDARDEKAAVGLARLKIQQGDSKAAEETLTRAAEGEAPGREVLFTLGDVAAAAGRADAAAAWFQKASTADPYWGKPLYRLGQLASARGDAAGATKYMERVVAVDPASPEATLAKSALGQPGK